MTIIFFFVVVSSLFSPLSGAQPTTAKDEFERYLFANNDQKGRKGPRTDGALVLHNGHIVYEKYARGYDQFKKHVVWSVSKTVMSLLYGVALREGRVRLEQSICDFGDFRREQCAIQIRDVLSWSSSIRWKEEYEGTDSPTQSSVMAMLYGQGRGDMASFVKAQPLEKNFKPGEIWRYSSGDSMLAAYLLGRIYKDRNLRQIYKEKIFDPLGIQHWAWESDVSGALVGAAYFYISARDLARIGELFLGQGEYKGQVIFTRDHWRFMTEVPASFKKNRPEYKGTISGAHLWVNSPVLELGKSWPAAPVDTVAALGHWGQYLAVVPSKKIVVVRIGDTRDGSVNINGLLERALALVDEAQK